MDSIYKQIGFSSLPIPISAKNRNSTGITSGCFFQGEYISPEKIENVYLLSKFVSQLFVHGDSLRTALVGVVVPDPEVNFSLFLFCTKFSLLLFVYIIANFQCLSRALSERCNIRGKSFKEICCLVEAKKILFEEMTTFGKKAGLCSFEQVINFSVYAM